VGRISCRFIVNGVLESSMPVNLPQDYGDRPVFFGSSGESNWDHKLKGSSTRCPLVPPAPFDLGCEVITAALHLPAARRQKAWQLRWRSVRVVDGHLVEESLQL